MFTEERKVITEDTKEVLYARTVYFLKSTRKRIRKDTNNDSTYVMSAVGIDCKKKKIR